MSEQDAERLRELERDANRPSPRFVSTVNEVARQLGLDPGPMIAGEGVEVHGLVFHVTHFGQSDPDGLTLFTRMGSIPVDEQAQYLLRLLEHNVSNPSYTAGFYGVMPDTNVVVMRTRIDLENESSAPARVLEYINALATQVQAINEMLKAGGELARLFADGQSPVGVMSQNK